MTFLLFVLMTAMTTAGPLAQAKLTPQPGGKFARGVDEAVTALKANPDNMAGKADWAPIRGGISADGTQGDLALMQASLAAAEQAFSDESQTIGLGPAFVKYGAPDAVNMGGAGRLHGRQRQDRRIDRRRQPVGDKPRALGRG